MCVSFFIQRVFNYFVARTARTENPILRLNPVEKTINSEIPKS